MHRRLLTNSQEEVVDVHGCFSRGLHKQQASVFSVCLSLLEHTQHDKKHWKTGDQEWFSFTQQHTNNVTATDNVCITSVAIR